MSHDTHMVRFDIPPDSPLVDGRKAMDVFAADHAAIIIGMHVAALVGIVGFASWTGALLLIAGHIFVFWLGVPLGFHKLLAHRSFEAPTWLVNVLATLGTLTFQGGPLIWGATHRAHHAHTDEAGDAHASVRGFWWSHVGWTFYRRPNGFVFGRAKALVPDLLKNPYLVWLDRHAVHLNLAAAALALLAFRRLDLVLWAFPVRIVVDWHITWLVNSYAHFAPIRGSKPHDEIRNSPALAALAFGEGWHQNHHRYPGRANFGLEPQQIDPAYLTLRVMQRAGLVRIRHDAHADT